MANLGFLADLVSQLLFRSGVAQTSRRAWNLSSAFSVSDDSANGRTDIGIDPEGLAGQSNVTPAATTGAATSAGAASSGLARADHQHRLGRGSTTSGDRDAATLSYDASAITSGDALGLVIDEETATSGDSKLLDMRREGVSKYTFRGDRTGSIGWTFDAGGALTATSSVGDVVEDLAAGGDGTVTVERQALVMGDINPSSDADIALTFNEETISWVEIIYTGAQVGGSEHHSGGKIRALVYRPAGSGAIVVETSSVLLESAGSTSADTVSTSVLTGTVTFEITNGDNAPREYRAYTTVTTFPAS